jgi:preprotein translocase subunit SecA
MVQRGHHFAIVDEVDSILIDEARTPLIISGPAEGDVTKLVPPVRAAGPRLTRDETTRSTRRRRSSASSSRASTKVEDYLGIDNLYESSNTPLIGYLNNAIKAKELFKRDKDYVVTDGEVLIVDEHTGRILPAAATTRACTRPSRPRRASRSRPRTRRSPPSPCRTTSACTTSSPA